MKQHTINAPVCVKGIGLHTGQPVTMTFLPANENYGFKFKRIDLDGTPTVAATIENVTSTNRGTTLTANGTSVHTVEHTLAALVGLSIDNVLIEIDAAEPPIMDGSSAAFVRALQAVGRQVQEASRDVVKITSPIFYKNPETGTELVALPSDHFEVITTVDFNTSILGLQSAQLSNINDFATEIAPCRTFVFLHELETLLDQGLIKGGDLDNAIVIVDKILEKDSLEQLAQKLKKPNVEVKAQGILNTTDLHFDNEPARHKLLDVIGDLALVGKPIEGKIIAIKPGHTANVQFAKQIKQAYQRQVKSIPKYDPTIDPLYDSVAIANFLPHRYPFLLIDKIIELSEKYVVGVKSVTFNELFFQGHFPGNPVMPGVLQIEAMAQTGGMLALSNVENPKEWDTYFLKIDNVRFRSKVVPGDTLILKLELLSPIRRGIFHMKGTAYVGDKVVSEGELTAQIFKKQ